MPDNMAYDLLSNGLFLVLVYLRAFLRDLRKKKKLRGDGRGRGGGKAWDCWVVGKGKGKKLR